MERMTVVRFNPQTVVGTTPLEKYNALFQGVPLWGGQDWNLSVEELVKLFHDALDEGIELLKKKSSDAISAFEARSLVVRIWKKFRGWKAPEVPSRQDLLKEMIRRCRSLADWMEANQSRRFYADSDMSVFIYKPRSVAAKLETELQ